jgi:hypothetical protein
VVEQAGEAGDRTQTLAPDADAGREQALLVLRVSVVPGPEHDAEQRTERVDGFGRQHRLHVASARCWQGVRQLTGRRRPPPGGAPTVLRSPRTIGPVSPYHPGAQRRFATQARTSGQEHLRPFTFAASNSRLAVTTAAPTAFDPHGQGAVVERAHLVGRGHGWFPGFVAGRVHFP